MDSGVAEATPAAAPAQALPKPSGTGLWAVVIDSYADESVAEQRRAQVQRMGVPAEVRWSLVKEQVRYRVVVPGYATQDAANDAAAELRRRKAGGAWVMRLPKQ
jgi:cell division protein FtsN